MKGLTIKFEEATLKWLKAEARASRKKVGALVREWIEERRRGAMKGHTVHEVASDLAGILEGGGISATNKRKKFRRP